MCARCGNVIRDGVARQRCPSCQRVYHVGCQCGAHPQARMVAEGAGGAAFVPPPRVGSRGRSGGGRANGTRVVVPPPRAGGHGARREEFIAEPPIFVPGPAHQPHRNSYSWLVGALIIVGILGSLVHFSGLPSIGTESTDRIGSATVHSSTRGSTQNRPGTQSLPALAALPESLPSLVLRDGGNRGKSQITSTFPDPAEADALFTKWGWSSSNYEIFSAPTGTTGENGVYEVDIGIHQLGGSKQAEEAMQYFMMARANLLGLWPAEVESLGGMSLALTGPSGDGGYEASVYAAIGSQVVRVTALSWYEYPLDYAAGIMRQMLATEQSIRGVPRVAHDGRRSGEESVTLPKGRLFPIQNYGSDAHCVS